MRYSLVATARLKVEFWQVLDNRAGIGVPDVTYAHRGAGTMHASGVGGATAVKCRKALNSELYCTPFPVALRHRSARQKPSGAVRKNLRTHLSTGAVDFAESRALKHLASTTAAARECLEHYKSDASGQRVPR